MTWSIGKRAIVADASVAVSLLLGQSAALRAWRAWTEDDALVLVPAHFGHEVANALLRSARIGIAATTAALEDLARLRYDVADRGLSGLSATAGLADKHGLSVYDAAYLELAIDVDGELATLDRKLRAAARAEAVAVVP
jgi:predicted nucleic acid-binding protein